MRIEAVRVGAVDVALKRPFKTALHTATSVRSAVLVVRTADGHLGWGEAPPTPAITGDTWSAILADLSGAALRLRGVTLRSPAEALSCLEGWGPATASARAAVDIAVHDAWARSAGVPLWALFGPSPRALVTDLTVSVDDPDTMAAEAARAAASGFAILKVKVGTDASRRLRLAALVSAALVALTPAVAATPAHAADAPILKLANVSDFDTFNPFTTFSAVPININRMQFESLVEVGKDNEPAPGFAEKWEASPDAKTWTLTVPEGRTWSDGQPATAEDAAFTLNAIMSDEKLGSANGSLVTNFAKVEAADPKTLVISMKEPQAANPGMEIPIVPKHVWEKVADKSTYLNEITEPVVGSGPFYITKFVKGQSVELAANPRFWRGAPKVAGLTWISYKNLDAAVQGLKAGEVDLVNGLTSAQFNSLKDARGITTSAGAGRRYQAIAINPGATSIDGKPMGDGNPALKDPQLRKAIFMAVDNKTLLDKVLGGLGKPGVTQMPPVYPTYHGLPDGAKERTFDLAAANTLLDEAGYKKGADGVRVDKQGKPLRLRLMGRNSAPEHAQMADFVKSWLADIGIATEVSMVAPSQVSTESSKGNYDLYFTGWGIGPDPDFQLSINTCASLPNADGSGNTNENNWCSPEFDRLYAAQHAELDPAKRAGLVKQAFQVIYDADVLDVVWYADQLEAWRSDRFADFQRQPSNGGVITAQSSYWGLYSATPVDAAAPQAAQGGLGTGAIVGIAVAALAVAGGLVFFLRRKPGGGGGATRADTKE